MENFITTSMLEKINKEAVENLQKLNLIVEDLTFEQIFKFVDRIELAVYIAKNAISRIRKLDIEIEAEDLLGIPRNINKKNGIEKRAKKEICFLLELIGDSSKIDLNEIANLHQFDLISE